MASGLSIVIDTRNAELNIKNLNQALERLETQGNSIANMMRNLGGNNPFAGLNAAVNITKAEFNALATSANTVKTATKGMGDALVYAKTTLTGAATAASTFQAAMRGVGNSLNTAQAAMARFNQSGQSIASVLNSMNGANGSNGVNNLNNAIKQLNPSVAALNAEFKAVNTTLNAFTTASNKADTAALRLNTTLTATRTNLTGLATANASVNASIGNLGNVLNNLQTRLAGLNTSITQLKDRFNDFVGASNTAKTAIKNLADTFTSAKTAIDNATTASNAFNDSVKKVYTSADILTNKIGALNGGFTVLSQKADTASSALSRFAQNATTTASSMGGLISQSHTLAQNMANMGAASNTGANNTGTALARVNGALSNTQAQMNGFNNTARNAQNTFNQFNANIHNTQNNFTQLNSNINLARNTFTQLNNTVNNSTTVINNYSRSLNNAANNASNASRSTVLFQRSAQGLEATLMRLQSLMTGGLFGMAAISIAKTADEMQAADSKIKLVTNSTEQYLAVRERVRQIADQNYNDISATTQLYQRSALALSGLGKSQNEVLKFTNAVSLAMRTGGSAANEQRAALLQLSQAMGAGKLMGDEFRSISENAPTLLKLISKEMGVTTGELKKLGSEGKITSEVMYNALTKNIELLESQAAKMPVTMTQAFTVAKNKYKEYVGDMMNSTGGLSGAIASSIMGIANNFDTIVKSMTIAGGLAFVQFAGKIDVATKAMGIFNLVAKANPLVLIVSTILAVSSAFYGLDDVINTTSVIMGDLFGMIKDGWTGIFSLISDGTDWLQGRVAQSNSDVEKSYTDMFGNVTTKQEAFYANAGFASNNLVKLISTDNMKNEQSYLGFYQKSEKGFTGLVQNLVGGVVTITAAFAGFFTWVGSHFADLGRQIANAAMDVADFGREVIDAGKRKLGFDVQPRVKEPRYALTNMDARDAFAEFNREGQKWVHDYFSGLTARVAAQPTVGMPPSGSGDLNSMMNPDANPAFLKQQEKERKEREEKERKKREKNMPSLMNVAVEAAQDLGVTERTDPNRIMGYQRAIGYLSSRIDAWCGSFVGASLLKAGFAIPKNAASARAWEQYGVGYDKNKVIPSGAVATIARKGGSGRHVFIVEKDLGNGKVSTIEGNVGDKVVRNVRNKSQIITVRIPITKDGQVANTNLSAKDYKGAESIDKNIDADYKKQFDDAMKLREQYGTFAQQQKIKLDKQILDINSNTLLSSTEKTNYIEQARKNSQRELSIYQESLFDMGRKSTEFAMTEAQKSVIERQKALDAANNDPNLSRPENKQILKNTIDAINAEFDHKEDLQNLADRKQLNSLYAFRKTSSELIKDEWDEKIAEAKLGNSKYKSLMAELFEEQKQRALDADKLQLNQQLLSLNQYKYSSFAFIDERLKLELEAIAQTTDAEVLKQAKIADAKKKAARDTVDADLQIAIDRIEEGKGSREEKDARIEAAKRKAEKLKKDITEKDKDKGMSAISDLFDSMTKAQSKFLDLNQSRNKELSELSAKYQKGEIVSYEAYMEQRNKIESDYIAKRNNLLSTGFSTGFSSLVDASEGFTGASSKWSLALSAINKNFVQNNPLSQMREKNQANNAIRDGSTNTANEMLKNGEIDYKGYMDRIGEINTEHIKRQRDILVDGYGGIFGGLSEIVAGFAGKQSKAYRVMFAVEKGFAIAKSVMAIQTAMASATASLPFPANLPVIAQVAAQGANIISTIQSVREVGFKTGGYTGNMGVNDVAGVVHGKEYVVNARNTVKYRDTLEQMNRGTYKEGANVQVNNYGSNKVDVRQENGLTIIDVRNEIERKMRADMRNPSSDVGKAIYGNSTARPRRD